VEKLPSSDPRPLKPRQRRFVEEYLRTGNALRSAIAAGYSAKTTTTQIMQAPEVAATLRRRLEAAFEAERMSVPEIIARLSRIGRVDPRQFFNEDGSYKAIHELDPEVAACIRGWEDELKFDADGAPPTMTRKIKIADPVPALRILAQIQQLLSPEAATVNIFLDLDSRLDAARRRVASERLKADEAKVVSEQ